MVYVPYTPILPFLLILILPLVYVLLRKREHLKTIIAIIVCSIATVILYPLVDVLSQLSPLFGYTIGKFAIFVFLPILTIFCLERSSLREIVAKLGVHKKNLKMSIVYGLIAAFITIAITTVIIQTNQFNALHQTVMFIESFTEEFFFRGFLFLYLVTKIKSFKVAFTTSILAFILAHPQHFISPFLISTAAQAILMTIVTHKTKNITGPWIGHGLNRVVPTLIRSVFG